MKNNGFTLTELLVVISLLGILGVGLVSLYSAQNKLTTDEANLTQAQVELAAGLNSALPFMLSANAVLASATINSTNYATASDVVVVSLPTVDSSNNIIAASFDNIAFIKSGDKFNMVTQSAAGSKRITGTRTLIKKIDNLILTYEDEVTPANSSWFTIEVQQQVKLKATTKTLTAKQRITLRNK